MLPLPPSLLVHAAPLLALAVVSAWPMDVPTPWVLFAFMVLYAVSISVVLSPHIRTTSLGKSTSSRSSGSGSSSSLEPKASVFKAGVTQARFRHGKTQYRIDLTYYGDSWSVWRSFSEIKAFYERHPPKTAKTMVKFPSKSSAMEALLGGDKTIQFVEGRKRQLDRAVRHVLSSKERFETVVALGRDKQTGKSPSGMFLAVPSHVDLSAAQVGPTREEIVKVGVEGLRLAWEHVHKIEGDGVAPWKIFNRSKDGVDLYFYEDGPRINHAVRSELAVNAVDLLDFLMDGEERLEWDDTFAGHTELDILTFEEHEEQANLLSDLGLKLLKARVVHARTRSPARLIVSDRDSVIVSLLAQRLSDGALVLGIKSIDDERAPPANSGGYVRVEVENSVTLVEPVPGKDACVFRTAGETDLKANVPKSFVKVFAPNKAAEVATFPKMAKDRATRKPNKITPFLPVN